MNVTVFIECFEIEIATLSFPAVGRCGYEIKGPPVWNHRSSLWFLFSVTLSLSFPILSVSAFRIF
jgi:hypothetical protein